VQEAVGVFEDLVAKHPQHAPVHAFYIDVLRIGNRYDEADALYAQAEESVRSTPIVLREMASLYEDMKAYRKALSFAKRAIEGDPSDVVAAGLLSRLHFALGDFAAAESAARHAIAAANMSTPEGMLANSLGFLGYALKAQERYEEATRVFTAERLTRGWNDARGELWLFLSQVLGDQVDPGVVLDMSSETAPEDLGSIPVDIDKADRKGSSIEPPQKGTPPLEP
jgi:tetratricopeptide (TPR) repeat protein